MQRDVEIEVETTDKVGGFIGTLYLNKTENAAVELVKAGLATVHAYSADSLSWSKQLFDAEVRKYTFSLQVLHEFAGRSEGSEEECKEHYHCAGVCADLHKSRSGRITFQKLRWPKKKLRVATKAKL